MIAGKLLAKKLIAWSSTWNYLGVGCDFYKFWSFWLNSGKNIPVSFCLNIQDTRWQRDLQTAFSKMKKGWRKMYCILPVTSNLNIYLFHYWFFHPLDFGNLVKISHTTITSSKFRLNTKSRLPNMNNNKKKKIIWSVQVLKRYYNTIRKTEDKLNTPIHRIHLVKNQGLNLKTEGSRVKVFYKIREIIPRFFVTIDH